jgi:hypothetical protein
VKLRQKRRTKTLKATKADGARVNEEMIEGIIEVMGLQEKVKAGPKPPKSSSPVLF